MSYYTLSCNSKEVGSSGEELGTMYKFRNSCPRCGTPAEVSDFLKIKNVPQLNQGQLCLFETLNRDLLISKTLYDVLLQEKSNLPLLKKAIGKTNQEEGLFHFRSDIYFPKSLPSTKGLQLENPCPLCLRSGHYGINFPKYIPFSFHYKADAIKQLKVQDLYNTWECFGAANMNNIGNRVIRYARPMVIITEKIKDLFQINRIDNLKFDKVILE